MYNVINQMSSPSRKKHLLDCHECHRSSTTACVLVLTEGAVKTFLHDVLTSNLYTNCRVSMKAINSLLHFYRK